MWGYSHTTVCLALASARQEANMFRRALSRLLTPFVEAHTQHVGTLAGTASASTAQRLANLCTQASTPYGAAKTAVKPGGRCMHTRPCWYDCLARLRVTNSCLNTCTTAASAYVLFVPSLVCGYLAYWQYERMKWKASYVQGRNTRFRAAPESRCHGA